VEKVALKLKENHNIYIFKWFGERRVEYIYS